MPVDVQSRVEAVASPVKGGRPKSACTLDAARGDARPTSGKVLILDANTRSALAATRSLGKRGVHVAVADETGRTLAGCSKHCGETFAYPPPGASPRAFIATLSEQCAKRGIGVIFPMTEISTAVVLRHRGELGELTIPFVDADTFDLLNDKWRLLHLAQELGVSIPRTHFIMDGSSLGDVYPQLTFPVVLKPYRSRICSGGRWISAAVQYAESARELEEIVARYEYFHSHPFLIQEYVPGRIHGIFALYQKGAPVVFFAHRRLREKPPSGGVSVLSESVDFNPAALRMARTLLDHVKWHGVAMVEFKVSPDGTPFLMEVNARFWGSLQLAIDAGIDFPWLLYQLAVNREIDQVRDYARGVRSRWLIGDLASLYRTLSNGSPSYLSGGSKAKAAVQFLRFFEPNIRYEVNRWNDPAPFFFELLHCFRH